MYSHNEINYSVNTGRSILVKACTNLLEFDTIYRINTVGIC